MADIKKMDIEGLQKEIVEKRESLRKFRFGEAGSRSRNVKEGRTLRRDIARIFTEIKSRDLASKKKNG
ncbi:50S ribosomal protein L29 [Candidatus Kaiserbacteria bacterium RIFCSPHIGHO2_01_FULL_56_24]|uniref:Large ribosomal subunit protein uL29 n=1 Tax=Candidatus Kaiserbacteria bacterium RIFCSPHIGHO2_01_FULL_56_24 TaxID=1798487 RepID=A0A1F6D9H5_9BACT|nr:MAG: 50S ribosomal protein L29 [Candidatus Kaiserbacteria bacterium RIFCSPHIGHO2_01_FULL_56_24]